MEIVELLVEVYEANVNAVNKDGNPALILAMEKGYVEIVKLLLEAGANANARDKDGNYALILAMEEGYVGIVKLLLEAGANTNARDEYGWTALMNAARDGHVEIVKLLLEAGADVNATDKYGDTVLELIPNSHEQILYTLIAAGARRKASMIRRMAGWIRLEIECLLSRDHPM